MMPVLLHFQECAKKKKDLTELPLLSEYWFLHPRLGQFFNLDKRRDNVVLRLQFHAQYETNLLICVKKTSSGEIFSLVTEQNIN